MPEKKSPRDSSEPVLILMRHAARDFSADGLSAEGLRQADQLKCHLEALKLPLPFKIESSPKLRTQATLRFLAHYSQKNTAVDPRLDERNAGETADDLIARVEAYLAECAAWAVNSKSNAHENVRLACSHLDWLEEAVLRLDSDENDFERSEPWPPLAIRGYVFSEGIWQRMRVNV